MAFKAAASLLCDVRYMAVPYRRRVHACVRYMSGVRASWWPPRQPSGIDLDGVDQWGALTGGADAVRTTVICEPAGICTPCAWRAADCST